MICPSSREISSLSHQAIRVLRSALGMTLVLVGMRRCAYVDDILQELRQPCVAEDRRTAWEELAGQSGTQERDTNIEHALRVCPGLLRPAPAAM